MFKDSSLPGFTPALKAGSSLRRTFSRFMSKPSTPSLGKIYVEPTTHCNLNCPMCMRHAWEDKGGAMSMDTFYSLMDGLQDVDTLQCFSFWGIGEPLMHPGIFEMIRVAKKAGAETEMITNGHLLTPEISRKLIEAGLDALIVSLEGTSRESYEKSRGADFDALMENLSALNQAKSQLSVKTPRIGLEFVISEENIDQLPALGDLARGLKAGFVIISNLLPYGEEGADDILYWLSMDEDTHTRAQAKGQPEVRLPRIDSRPEYQAVVREFLKRLPFSGQGKPVSAKGYCPFVEKGAMAVRWDGSVSPCVPLMHPHQHFVMGHERSVLPYHIGNVNSQDAAAIWKEDEYVRFRKRVQDFDFPPCHHCDCDLALTNETDCCGSPFPTCGDCLWAHNIVLCP